MILLKVSMGLPRVTVSCCGTLSYLVLMTLHGMAVCTHRTSDRMANFVHACDSSFSGLLHVSRACTGTIQRCLAGTFKLTLEFSEEYPNKAPVVKFKSTMFHPNSK